MKIVKAVCIVLFKIVVQFFYLFFSIFEKQNGL